MKLCLINNNFRYELEKLVRLFLPFEKVELFDTPQTGECVATVELDLSKAVASAELYIDGRAFSERLSIERDGLSDPKLCELKAATVLYKCFCRATDYTPEWGMLTGVRPAKLLSRLITDYGTEGALEYFKNALGVSDSKTALCREALSGEEKIISLSKSNSYSLYISIPFCPTRCAYCSFVSHSVEKAERLIEPYVELLCNELKQTAEAARENGLRLETVYIGGGTPTAISAEALEKIIKTVSDCFDLSHLREYTVEAGRPDTVTEERLTVIKNNGATRISINPQSMNDSVLTEIGRRHTAEDTVNAFKLARRLGFDNINMDLIAGLPTDTFDSFRSSIERVIELDPESVTVHSLSVKRSSRLNTTGELPETEAGKIASQMVEYARKRLSEKKILPYYMYRQSKTVGNLENVGYSKKGFEGLYNVYIMDETHTILACGASAVTKLRQPGGNYIERIFNFKYPYEYINRFNEITDRKKGITAFYEKYGK